MRLGWALDKLDTMSVHVLEARRDVILKGAALAQAARGVGRTETGGFGKSLEALSDQLLDGAKASKRTTDGLTPWLSEEVQAARAGVKQLASHTLDAGRLAGETRRDAGREVDAASASVASLLSAGGEPPSPADEAKHKAYLAATARLAKAMKELRRTERQLDARAAHCAAETIKGSKLRLEGLRGILLDLATAEVQEAQEERVALGKALEAA